MKGPAMIVLQMVASLVMKEKKGNLAQIFLYLLRKTGILYKLTPYISVVVDF